MQKINAVQSAIKTMASPTVAQASQGLKAEQQIQLYTHVTLLPYKVNVAKILWTSRLQITSTQRNVGFNLQLNADKFIAEARYWNCSISSHQFCLNFTASLLHFCMLLFVKLRRCDASSPYIHPIGWCQERNLPLTPPQGEECVSCQSVIYSCS